jgi:hypothetical protein
MTTTRDAVVQLLRSTDPFVRRRIGHGAFVGVRYPYLYVETPKSGCTTTKLHLWNLERLGPIPYESRPHERPPGDPRLSLLSVSEDRALDALQGHSIFRFCVWRDPVRRLASAFWEKIHLGTDPGAEWPQWRAHIVRAFGLASEKQITLDHFVQFVCALPDHQRDFHFMSQWRLNLADLIQYHRVVRLDRYAEDMAGVYASIGVPEAEWPPLDIRENSSGSEVVQVSEQAAAMIRAAFRTDYDLLNLAPARYEGAN